MVDGKDDSGALVLVEGEMKGGIECLVALWVMDLEAGRDMGCELSWSRRD